MAIEITPVGPKFVARVRGIDLLNDLDSESFAIIRRALDDHSILIFPDQPWMTMSRRRFCMVGADGTHKGR